MESSDGSASSLEKNDTLNTKVTDQQGGKKSYKKIDNYVKLMMRCSPGTVIKAAMKLSSDARDKVIALGFEQLLCMTMEGMETREAVTWLMDQAHVEQPSGNIVIKIGDTNLHISENVVAHTVGAPKGNGDSLPKLDRKTDRSELSAVSTSVRLMLGLPAKTKGKSTSNLLLEVQEQGDEEREADQEREAGQEREGEGNQDDQKTRENRKKQAEKGQISMDFLMDKIEEFCASKESELEAKCFLFIAFSCFLMPSTSNYLTPAQMYMVNDLDRLGRINWRNEILKDLANSLSEWKARTKGHNIKGCMAVLLVSFLYITIIFHE